MDVDLSDQRSVTTWSRLLRLGCTPAQIRAQLDAGRWRRWGYAIVRHNGPLSRRETWFVARAHGGPGALLTSFTAMEAYGLRGWERDQVHVLTRLDSHGSAKSPVPMQRHRVRDWSAVRRHAEGPVQVPRQSLLVAAATFATPRPACGILAAAVQQGLTSPEHLHSALTESSQARHRRQLILGIADIAQGADALSEIDFVRLCRRAGLPAPMQQVVRREPSGHRRYLDASWRRSDGRLVVVEVDGALHLTQRRWWADQSRQNEIALADALLLRYPSVVVRTEAEVVLDQLTRALLLHPRPRRAG